jgi:hypothetical protein
VSQGNCPPSAGGSCPSTYSVEAHAL